MKPKGDVMKLLLLLLSFNAFAQMPIEQILKPEPEERQGCCSWHGGVCGCSSAGIVCCDGTQSPTCGC